MCQDDILNGTREMTVMNEEGIVMEVMRKKNAVEIRNAVDKKKKMMSQMDTGKIRYMTRKKAICCI